MYMYLLHEDIESPGVKHSYEFPDIGTGNWTWIKQALLTAEPSLQLSPHIHTHFFFLASATVLKKTAWDPGMKFLMPRAE